MKVIVLLTMHQFAKSVEQVDLTTLQVIVKTKLNA